VTLKVADTLTCDRTPQNVTIEPMLIFFERKGLKVFQKKNLGATEFYGKMGQKIDYSRLFCCHLIQKSSYFDKNINVNLNLNHKCLSPTWRKPI
jgi:hypothetical protein